MTLTADASGILLCRVINDLEGHNGGIPVRTELEITSPTVRTIKKGEVFKATARRRCTQGVMRLRVSDGWVSERSICNGQPADFLTEITVAPEFSGIFFYRVIDELPGYDGGIPVRIGIDTSSEVVRILKNGEVFTATERRLSPKGIMRLRIKDGWVSERGVCAGQPSGFLVEANVAPQAKGIFVYRVIDELPGHNGGIPVRVKLDTSSEVVRTITKGEVFTATERRLNSQGVMRVRVPDGWVSERGVYDGQPSSFLIEDSVAPEGFGTFFYRVIDELPGYAGIPVRGDFDLLSQIVRLLPKGELFTARERRMNAQGVMRLRVQDGWVSERGLCDGQPSGFLVEAAIAPEGSGTFFYRVIEELPGHEGGIPVRRELDTSSEIVRTMVVGEVFTATERRLTLQQGIMRLRVQDGWVSERFAVDGHPLGFLVEEKEAPQGRGTFFYCVIDGLPGHGGGIPVRKELVITSDIVRTIKKGEVFTATERRRNAEGLMRLRLEDGWVSERSVLDGLPFQFLVQATSAQMPNRPQVETDVDDDKMCVVCLTAPREFAVIHGDAAHLCVCKECCADFERRQVNSCPICRRPIDRLCQFFG